MSVPSPEGTAAVVVLFQPQGDLCDRLRRVLPQVAKLVIIANDGLSSERLGNLPRGKIHYILELSNRGLGVALNLGLDTAQAAGMTWALLLDQDSVVDEGLVEGLRRLYDQLPKVEAVAVLAPNYRSPLSNKLAYATEPSAQAVSTVITSGSMVRLEALSKAGRMNENLFIEGIDLEFSLRARKTGYQLWVSGPPLMTHGAGQCAERQFGRRTVLISHHSAWRYYLQFRNVSWILWRYVTFDPAWSLQAVIGLGKKFILILLFERQRPIKVLAIICGLFDGTVNRLGRGPHFLMVG